MSKVRSKGTLLEREVIASLRSNGVKFSTSRQLGLPGSPDIVLSDKRVAIFVHGCFWHGHLSCKKGTTLPKTNRPFWKAKIHKNRVRDSKVSRKLRKQGYSVVTLWECKLKNKNEVARRLTRFE